MSEARLLKHIAKGTRIVNNNLTFKPVIVGDSKGSRLKSLSTGSGIQFYCKGGATSTDTIAWLQRNIGKVVQQFGQIHIYLWIGTCDLTSKDGHYISLNPESSIKKLKDNFSYIRDHYLTDKVHITFLQVPYYSIRIWNKLKGHKEPENFKNDDIILNERVNAINEFIDNLNSEINVYSPKFNLDLVRSRKSRKTTARYSWNFKLLPDGIHASKKLSLSWLTSLVKNINSDCA